MAAAPEADGQGCPGEQLSSRSFAATACRRTRVPSSQRRVSPSVTEATLQKNLPTLRSEACSGPAAGHHQARRIANPTIASGANGERNAGGLWRFRFARFIARHSRREGPLGLSLLTGGQTALRRNIARPSRANSAIHSHVPANTPSSWIKGPSPRSRKTYRRIAASVTMVSIGTSGRCPCVPLRIAI